MKRCVLCGVLLLCTSLLFPQSWSSTGNSGMNPTVNFLGTTDSNPLVFKVNSVISGFTGNGLTDYANVSFGYKSLNNTASGGRNLAVGIQALTNNQSGWSNIAIGYWALDSNYSGSENIAIGVSAMAQSAGNNSWNVAIGTNSLKTNRGYHNTAVGTYTLNYNTSGSLNTAIGTKALLANTTGSNNTALGAQSMISNTTGEINLGCGSGTLYSNTTGSHNTAVGNSALWSNVAGNENTSIGDESLAGNIDGNYNVAVGTRSLWSGDNTSSGFSGWGHASMNTATGWESMRSITSGSNNSSFGYHSMMFTSSGHENSAFGQGTLMQNTTGNGNVAFGFNALQSNTTGSNNTTIGYQADVASGSLTNAIALGYGARATRSNSAVLGNESVVSIGGFSSWSTLIGDDSKQNITANVPGLAFINQLNPVTFNVNNGDQMTYSGFSIQNVSDAASSLGYSFNGIDNDGNSNVGLRYAMFVVPMVQAIKELGAEVNKKDSIINSLQSQMNVIMDRLSSLDVQTRSANVNIKLYQNYPNPFNTSTTVKFDLPENFDVAKVVFYNQIGAVVYVENIAKAGENTFTVDNNKLKGNGCYFYSLYVDGKLIDTKKMILN